jgi:hypothetical protein
MLAHRSQTKRHGKRTSNGIPVWANVADHEEPTPLNKNSADLREGAIRIGFHLKSVEEGR